MKFEDIIACMEPPFEQLQSSQPCRAPTYYGLPEKGIYVFYEHGKPLYVGRVGSTSKQSMRSRIQQHTRPSSGHNTATFAFILLREMFPEKLSRAEFENEYEVEFKHMKERVRNMDVRAVEIEDSKTQTVFEVYASMALRTCYNKFDTH